jgi:hypothetical protein
MPLPKNTKDLNGIRDFFTQLKTQFASASAVYEGPIKQLFDEVTGRLQGVLDGLPKTEGEEPVVGTGALFETLASANNLVSLLSLEFHKVKTAASAAPDTLTAALAAGTHLSKADHETRVAAAVASAIAERTGDKGDLVAKNTVSQLCSAAKDLGLKEGREQLQTELNARQAGEKLAADRKTALTAAGLPLPEAEAAAILADTEERYSAARAKTEDRVKAITAAGLELPAELLANCWLPDTDFQRFQKTVTSIPALKVRAGQAAAEPFAAPPAGGGGAQTVRMLG